VLSHQPTPCRMARKPLDFRPMKKQHPMVKRLLTDIEKYRSRSRESRTTFGVNALNDAHLLDRLEGGRLPKITTIDRIYQYIESKTKAVRR